MPTRLSELHGMASRVRRVVKKDHQTTAGTRVLACRALAPELQSLGVPLERMRLLDQGLHRYPGDLQRELTHALDELESQAGVSTVVLAYGYCGGGLEGLSPRRVRLILPRVHDCIPLLLGRTLDGPVVEKGGAFYLSPGWIEHGQTPYTEFFRTRERFGDEEALWTAKEMLKGYGEVVLIETLAGLTGTHRRYAREMARLFGLSFRKTHGDSRFLKDLLAGRNRPHVLRLKPGEVVSAELYRQPAEGV